MKANFKLLMIDANKVDVTVDAERFIHGKEDKMSFLKTVARLLGVISEEGDILFIEPDETLSHEEVFGEDV